MSSQIKVFFRVTYCQNWKKAGPQKKERKKKKVNTK